jgi:FAD:protein FMN transferase
MGTIFRMVLYAPDPATAAKASRAAFDRIQTLDNIMSDYQPGSELRQLCDKAGGPPVKVSEDLFRVLAAAEQVSTRSHGAFDITVGPVVRLWRRARRRHELPDPERLAAARDLVGYEKVRLDPQARTVQLTKPGMMLDLGGIAKGDAADQALMVLQGFGVTRTLVAAAGDIAVGDPPPHRSGWRIEIAPLELANGSNEGRLAPPPAGPTAQKFVGNGQRTTDDGPRTPSSIQNPKAALSAANGSKIQNRFVLLHNAGISTSGDKEQHVEIGGVRYSHIVDPKTGMALTGRSSVTVVAPHDITADSYATAVSVLGRERGLELINSTPGAGALIMVESGNTVQTFESRFPPPQPQ